MKYKHNSRLLIKNFSTKRQIMDMTEFSVGIPLICVHLIDLKKNNFFWRLTPVTIMIVPFF